MAEALKGEKPRADEHGCGDGDGGSEARGTFEEASKGEGDEESLEARVGGEATEGVLDDLELAGLDGDAEEEDGGEDNPRDGEETKGSAVGGG